MAQFVLFQQFKEDLGKGVHNLDTGAIKAYLTNTAPDVAAHGVKADLAEITNQNGYAAPVDIAGSYTESAGVGTFSATDQTITASGGPVGPFRYVVIYNDTPTSPADPLIGYVDYGLSVTLLDGESMTINFGASVFTIGA